MIHISVATQLLLQVLNYLWTSSSTVCSQALNYLAGYVVRVLRVIVVAQVLIEPLSLQRPHEYRPAVEGCAEQTALQNTYDEYRKPALGLHVVL